MERLTITARAKINLHLQVLGRRGDGFRELRTLLQSIDLGDELVAEPAAGGVLELHLEGRDELPADEGNLVVRAARLLQQRVGRDPRPGARLWLRKCIPVGAGLGGGSADAAAALVLLNRLWSGAQPPEVLHELAARLGSDVPFFLHGGLALGVGRGEEVYPLPDLDELGLIVAMPRITIATAEAYGRLPEELTWVAPDATVYCFCAGLGDRLPWSGLVNDLQPVVTEGWPEVAELLQVLQQPDPLLAAVTGSGAAVFALFESPDRAEGAAEALAEVGGDRWWIHAGRTLSRERSRPVVREQRQLE